MKTYSSTWSLALASVALALAAAPPARGIGPVTPDGRVDPPKQATEGITVDEKLGGTVPTGLEFTDDAGRPVKLSDYLGKGRPVVLQLGYYGCPMLCDLVSQGLVNALRDVPLGAGREFELVYVSIDPSEAEKPDLVRKKKESFVKAYGRAGAEGGIHLLTGRNDRVAELADAVGFRYRWVASAGQYSHPAALVVLSPDGKVTRYLYGVTFDPTTVRLSLVEASEGKVGSTVDKFILTCFQYDGKQGKYAATAIGIMKAGGALTILVVGTTIGLLFAREARQRRAARARDRGLLLRGEGPETLN